jgi:hypothetical protein
MRLERLMAKRFAFVAAMTLLDFQYTFAFPRRNTPELCMNFRPIEGAGNAGRPMRPQPRVRNKKHTSVVTTVTPVSPGIPRAMVLTVSFALSQVTGLSCHLRFADTSASLTPASGRQDHTTSPSASAPFVGGTIGVHRIPHRRP